MDARKDLLQQLNDGQWLLLRAVADIEEESGDPARAAGWRWLADQRRWPICVVRQDMDDQAECWEWWRARDDAAFSCSLPALLMEHVRRINKAIKGQTCRFTSASQALGCAATCAGQLIHQFGSVE